MPDHPPLFPPRLVGRDRAIALLALAERTAALAAQTGDVRDLDDAAEACRKAAEAFREAGAEEVPPGFREAHARIEDALTAELAAAEAWELQVEDAPGPVVSATVARRRQRAVRGVS